MLTNIFAIGILGETVGSRLRLLVVQRNYKNAQGKFDVDEFICCHWSRQENNYFMKAETGNYVAIRGHLETNDDRQTILFVEYVEFLGKSSNNGLLIADKEVD